MKPVPQDAAAPKAAAEETDEHTGLPMPRRLLAIAAISFGNMVLVLDGSIANVALPTLARELSVTPGSATNVIVVYQLVLVMGLLPMSNLGSRIGLRRLYQAGLAIFCVASAACFFVETLPQLLLLRAVQGFGATMGLAVSVAMLRAIYPSRSLGAGLGLNSVVVTSSLALGPMAGGYILARFDWQWIFVMAAPLAVVSLLLGRALPANETRSGGRDIAGSIWVAVTMALLIGGVQVATHLQPVALGIGVVAIGLISIVFLVRREGRRDMPIVPVDLLISPKVGLSLLAAFAAFMTAGVMFVALPFRLEQAMGFAPDEVGLLLMPMPLTLMLVNPLAGWLSDRIAPSKLGISGLFVASFGLVMFAFMPDDASVFDIVWRMVVFAAGFGFFIAPNARLIVGSVPLDRTAAIGGMMQTTRLFGQALAASVVGVLLALGMGEGAVPPLISAGLAMVAAACSLVRFRTVMAQRRRETFADAPY